MAEKASATTALQWVERLLEPSASEDMMIEAAQVFSPGHYSDVVDERIISRLCGYPPCSNPLDLSRSRKTTSKLSELRVTDEGEDAESGDSEPRDSVHLAHPKLSPVGRLLHAMSSWCTPDTRCFVEQARQQTHSERDPVQTPERDSGKVYAPCVVEGSNAAVMKRPVRRARQRVEDDREDLDDVQEVLPPVQQLCTIGSSAGHLGATVCDECLKCCSRP
ncbi:Putative RNA polymerase II subunit B1 CTD phosphatase RPAP2 [Geodia barretti]|uniref:RNA polymerase II subunit B1 CTD phosphatase RPAP2 homolog n=1 Tax=Geodia barretti TaxID=519541 RepID=A0AA35SMC9_GEOBA|nr:Putative RNA polymerase II subunit B1 CTD phosphatase RPAP2 [Geodia barretti]